MSRVSKRKLVKIQTYVTKATKIKFKKKRGKAGYISDSDYLRDLVLLELKN